MARQAERTAGAAQTVRGGGTIDDDDVRRWLADLLEVCSRTAIDEALKVHVRDKIAALSDEITRAGTPRPNRPAHPATGSSRQVHWCEPVGGLVGGRGEVSCAARPSSAAAPASPGR
jgi:hypothetical protein